ncbi:hypothetical protein ZEAMMB73_Zm00001d038654 [Zea mays]|uniref:Uncharacterized protein n=1 Tax=Zea mays TaxID=4577 RepID=A0A1D6M7T0_MAIZE|nr:hypothetical protein ZEAMMB73_Zm00001d038654 [Zea mays]
MWMAYSMSYVVVFYAVGIIQDVPFRAAAAWTSGSCCCCLVLKTVAKIATGRNASYQDAIWAFDLGTQRAQGAAGQRCRQDMGFYLAFALFKVLKRRFYGYVPAEARLG